MFPIALGFASTDLYHLVEINTRAFFVPNSSSEKQISARLDSALADQFAAICKAKGLKQGFVIKELVRGWVEGGVPQPGETAVFKKPRATSERSSP